MHCVDRTLVCLRMIAQTMRARFELKAPEKSSETPKVLERLRVTFSWIKSQNLQHTENEKEQVKHLFNIVEDNKTNVAETNLWLHLFLQ